MNIKNLYSLLENRKKGVSMAISLCACALIMGLSLSLIYSSSLPVARANSKVGREKSYQLAKSFSEVLDTELRCYTTERYDLGVSTGLIAPNKSFYIYANRLLEGVYGEYDPDRPELTTYYYTSATGDDDYGTIVVKLRKETSGDEDIVTGGSFSFEDSGKETDIAEGKTFIRYLFYVDVTSTLGADSYTYSTEYYRKDSFVPHYVWTGELSGTHSVYWNRTTNSWYLDSNFETPMYRELHKKRVDTPTEENPDAYVMVPDPENPEIVTIDYTYNPNGEQDRETTFKNFLPTYLERGGA